VDEERLEALLDRARGSGHRERLVEVGRRRGAHPSSTWWWSSGRIRAVIRKRSVKIVRELGQQRPGIELVVDELRVVARACRAWECVRHRWALFDQSAAGLPGSVARDFVYQPPGKNGRQVVIGSWRMGHRTGSELVGKDVLVPLRRLRPVAARVTRVAELWHRRERVGPRAGALVGARWDLGDGLVIDARREELRVARLHDRGRLLEFDDEDTLSWERRDEVVIEEGEPAFIRALVRAVAREARAVSGTAPAISPTGRQRRTASSSRIAGTARSPRRRG